MFFNIFVCFLKYLITKCRSSKIHAILSVKSASGKVFDNYELRILNYELRIRKIRLRIIV